MPNYRAIAPKAWLSATHTPEPRPTCEVIERSKELRETGILNADGWMIYDVPEDRPIGFMAG